MPESKDKKIEYKLAYKYPNTDEIKTFALLDKFNDKNTGDEILKTVVYKYNACIQGEGCNIQVLNPHASSNVDTLKIEDNNKKTYILKIYFKDANYNKTLLENFKKEFNINYSPYLDSLIEPPILVTSLKTENIYFPKLLGYGQLINTQDTLTTLQNSVHNNDGDLKIGDEQTKSQEKKLFEEFGVQVKHSWFNNYGLKYGVKNHYNYVIIEDIDGISLKDYMFEQKSEKFSYSVKNNKEIFTELCKAINLLHKDEISHGDLKPENIMVVKNSENNDKYSIKLIDLDCASKDALKKGYNSCFNQGFTSYYSSPERIYSKDMEHYDDEDLENIKNIKNILKRNDIWALGLILIELFKGITLYSHEHNPETILSLFPDAYKKEQNFLIFLKGQKLDTKISQEITKADTEGNKLLLPKNIDMNDSMNDSINNLINDILTYDDKTPIVNTIDELISRFKAAVTDEGKTGPAAPAVVNKGGGGRKKKKRQTKRKIKRKTQKRKRNRKTKLIN